MGYSGSRLSIELQLSKHVNSTFYSPLLAQVEQFIIEGKAVRNRLIYLYTFRVRKIEIKGAIFNGRCENFDGFRPIPFLETTNIHRQQLCYGDSLIGNMALMRHSLLSRIATQRWNLSFGGKFFGAMR